MNPDGSDVQQLTTSSYTDAEPCFSPDGQKIVFRSQNSDSPGIYIMDADGQNQVRLTSATEQAMQPSFSPDGQHIVYVSYQPGPVYGGYRVCVMDADGSNEQILTSDLDPDSNSSDYSPHYSPDGNQIAFYREQSDSETVEGHADLMLMNASGGAPTVLTDNTTTLLYDRCASFSPDGQTIIFQSAASGAEDGTLEQFDLYTIKVDGTERQQVTTTPGIELNPCYSPDGSKITFEYLESYISDDREIFVMDAPSGANGGTNLNRSLRKAFQTRDVPPDGRMDLTQNSATDQTPDWIRVEAPVMTVSSPLIKEGNSGTALLVFTLALSKSIVEEVHVTVESANASASAGVDYIALAPTVVTFAPRQTSKTVTIQVKGDTIDEDNERIKLLLSSPVGLTLSSTGSEGIIIDDDGVPSVSVNDVQLSEGNRGVTKALFTLSLSNASSKTITLNWMTQTPYSGGATPGKDYIAVEATSISFAPNQTSKTVSVSVVGDTLDEVNEAFYIKLSSAVNVRIFDGTGVGLIVDDDAPPTAFVKATSVLEGNTGQSTLPFEVKLSGPSGLPITIFVRPLPGATFPATANLDYQATPLTALRFAPGEVSKTVTVLVKGDTTDENNERVALELSRPINTLVSQPVTEGVIVDDDGPSIVSINSMSITEGSRGTKTANFTVSLSAASGKEVKIDFTALPKTASSGSDYVDQKGTLVFSPGETRKIVYVVINGDINFERDEQFVVVLSHVLNASVGTAVGTGTIINDDAPPSTKSTTNSSIPSDSSSTS